MTLREVADELRACLDGRTWQNGYRVYHRLLALLKRIEAAIE